MGIVSTIGNMLGLNLESKAKKVVFLIMLLGLVTIVLTPLDPFMDKLWQNFTGDPNADLPLSLGQIMTSIGMILTPFKEILGIVKENTIDTFYQVTSLAFSIIAILFGGKPLDPDSVPSSNPMGSRLSFIANYFVRRGGQT